MYLNHFLNTGIVMENTKGVALVRMEDGREVYQPKIAFLRMKKAGRDVELIAEALTREELDKKLGRC
jgi:hypothetical protein